ncbi:hypothetical protein SUDANB6_00193 [Streptomyces sp. enrichment culture]
MLAVVAYCFVVTWLLAQAIGGTMGMRPDAEAEGTGVGLAVHGEAAFDLDGSRHRLAPTPAGRNREVVRSA